METPVNAKNILFVDDDPDHLKIYGWMLKQAGYVSIPCLVSRRGIDIPVMPNVHLVVLDYNLNCDTPTSEIAQSILDRYPEVPIVLLSQVDGLPREMEPFVDIFVRKGEPGKLTDAIRTLLHSNHETTFSN